MKAKSSVAPRHLRALLTEAWAELLPALGCGLQLRGHVLCASMPAQSGLAPATESHGGAPPAVATCRKREAEHGLPPGKRLVAGGNGAVVQAWANTCKGSRPCPLLLDF